MSLHAVVGTPQSAMCVVPLTRDFIDRSLFQKLSPLVMPEFQPQCEPGFIDLWKMPHQRLQIFSRFELWFPCHVARDDGRLVEMAHLDRNRKPLQQATSAITDDGEYLPALCFQFFNAALVRTDGFVGEKLPEEILPAMGTPPYHDAEEASEVGGIHDNDDLIGCKLLLRNFDPFQLTLHPLGTASVLPGDICVTLFTASEVFPD